MLNGHTYTYTATVVDAAGNQDPNPSNTWTVTYSNLGPAEHGNITQVYDDFPPVTGDVTSGGWTNDTTPTLHGTITDNNTGNLVGLAQGDTLHIFRQDGTGAAVDVTAQGTLTWTDGSHWAFQDYSLTDAHQYTYTTQVIATGGNGQSTGPSTAWVINIDATAPSQRVTIDSYDDQTGTKTGPMGSGTTTDEQTPILHGTVSPGLAPGGGLSGGLLPPSAESLHLTRTDNHGNVKDCGTVTVNSDGTWTYKDGSLSDQTTYTYTAWVEDQAGNTSYSQASFTLTTQWSISGQTVTINHIMDAAQPNLGDIATQLGGNTNDPNPWLDGTVNPLNTDDYIVIYRQTDGGTRQAVSGHVTITPAGISGGTWSWQDTNLQNGHTYSYVAEVVNANGNTVDSVPYAIKVVLAQPIEHVTITGFEDNTPPVVCGNYQSGTYTDEKNPVLHGKYDQPLQDNEYIAIYRNNTFIGTVSVGNIDKATNTWTYADQSNLGDGAYNYYAQVQNGITDPGQPSSPLFTINVNTSVVNNYPHIDGVLDGVDPYPGTNVTNGGYTNDTRPTIQGSLDQALNTATNETLHIWRQDNSGQMVDVTGQGVLKMIDATHWTYQDNTALADGHAYTYQAEVVGNAGSSAYSGSYTINIQTLPPLEQVSITGFEDKTGDLVGFMTTSPNNTDEQSPLLRGTIKDAYGNPTTLLPGEQLVIYRNGQMLSANDLTVNSDGTWTYQDGGLLDKNNYIYTAYVQNQANLKCGVSGTFELDINTSHPAQRVEITQIMDAVEPVTGPIPNDGLGYTNDPRPVITGSIDLTLNTGDQIIVTRTDTTSGETIKGIGLINSTLDPTGHTWTYQDSLANAMVGTHVYTYTAQVVSSASNGGAISQPWTIHELTTSPFETATINTYTDKVGPEQGNFTSGTTTDDQNPILNGTINLVNGELALPANERVAVYDTYSHLVGYGTLTDATHWSLPLTNLQTDTTYAYNAYVEDLAGNQSTPNGPFSFLVQLNVTVNSQNTLDPTPIISGLTGFAMPPGSGEYLTVQLYYDGINGNTPGGAVGPIYTSQNGQVVVDSLNNSWYLQIPSVYALQQFGYYDVKATLYKQDGSMIATDRTTNELYISKPPVPPPPPTVNDPANKAVAMTIGENGQWRLFANMTILDANGHDSTDVTSLSANAITGNGTRGQLGSAVFMDFDRDGLMELTGQDSWYADGQQSFKYLPGATQTAIPVATASIVNTDYIAFQLGVSNQGDTPNAVMYSGNGTSSANAWTYWGGTVAYDKTGNGYADLAYGDAYPNDEYTGQTAAQNGWNTSFLINNSGVYFSKDPSLVNSNTNNWSAATGGQSGQSTPGRVISAADLNNDGTVELVWGSTSIMAASNYLSNTPAATSTNANRMMVAEANAQGILQITQIINGALYYDNSTANYNGQSMTWADFNGDGYLDLFQARSASSGTNGAGANTGSFIWFNDGSGHMSVSGAYSATAVGTAPGSTYTMTNSTGAGITGGGSLAVDWNMDGKMDVIQVPYWTTAPAANQQVLLFTNNMLPNGTANFTTTTLTTVSAGTASGNAISGMLAVDLDWDGAKELILFTGNKGTFYVDNPNTIAYGTSLHLKVLDQNGINSLYANTVQLYDDQTGRLVSTQVINPQSGNQTSDSSALVDFYGLDPSHTYSALLYRTINGVEQNVGGMANLGGHVVENVNSTWAHLTATDATHAYVLTAESDTAINDAYNVSSAAGIPAGTGGVGGTISLAGYTPVVTGLVGTGYNDTFFATGQGSHDKYEGGGGWAATGSASGIQSWSNTGGMDIVDYKLSTVGINVDMSINGEQWTGFNYATFSNINGIAGTSGNDTFTDSMTGNNMFNGRGGNDTFNLTHGGHDTLMYTLLNPADSTGGNGQDQVNGWKVGTFEATPTADRIDISQLLSSYQPVLGDGPARYINGVATIDPGDTITKYLSVTEVQVQGQYGVQSNTVISIDMSGTGHYTPLVTLNNVHIDLVNNDALTPLAMLLANHQIVV
jgi:hypothetical protein